MPRYIEALNITLTDEQVAFGRRWIAALRSAEYQQGKGRLRRLDNTYCCLGVACDVYDLSLWREPNEEDDYGAFVFSEYGASSGLPREVIQATGLSFFGVVPDPDFPSTRIDLTVLNDAHNFTFPMIADHLEQHVYGKEEA